MKKNVKKMLTGYLGATLVFASQMCYPVVGHAAEFTDSAIEYVFDDVFAIGEGENIQEEEFTDESGEVVYKDSNVPEEIPEIGDASEKGGLAKIDSSGENEIVFNTYYAGETLQRDYRCYKLKFNIPEDGRIRLMIDGLRNPEYIDYYTLPIDNSARAWKEEGIESLDSGWITVKKGVGYLEIALDYFNGYVGLNRDSRVIVQYQKTGDYYGECEDNDTFDEADVILHGKVYEGNYSKSGDVDIFKFSMEQSGVADIKIENNDEGKGILYEEDVNGNVYEIDEISSTGHFRLAKGTYFIKKEPQVYGLITGYDTEYSLNVNVNYESADEYEIEKNNTKIQANEKNANVWYTGNLNTSRDIDYYKFNIDRPCEMALELKIPRQLHKKAFKISLYDEKLRLLDSAYSTENPYLITDKQRYLPGIYYIRIEHDYGSYYNCDYSFCLNCESEILVTKIMLPTEQRIAVGKTATLVPEIVPENANNKTIEWSSSDKSIATVARGKIVAKAPGTVTITAMATDGSGIKASCKVTVTPTLKEPTISQVKSSAGKLTISWNKISDVHGYVLYRSTSSKGTYKKIAIIRDESTTSYTDNGLEGNKRYYYKLRSYKKIDGNTFYSGYSAARSRVTEPPKETNKLNKIVLQLAPKQTYTLNVGTTKTVKWSSSNSDVASVSSSGKVTAKTSGTAVITATFGSNKLSCRVGVLSPDKVYSINRNSSFLGKVYRETWEHPTMGEQAVYILKLVKPIKFDVNGYTRTVSEIHLLSDNASKYVGKYVIVKGFTFSGDTWWYRRLVSMNRVKFY